MNWDEISLRILTFEITSMLAMGLIYLALR
jgi:hypothetical protein